MPAATAPKNAERRLIIQTPSNVASSSNAAFSLDNQDACLTARVSDVLATDLGEEDISCVQGDDLFCAIFPVMHINRPVQNREDLLAFVDVPLVRSICPVQARR